MIIIENIINRFRVLPMNNLLIKLNTHLKWEEEKLSYLLSVHCEVWSQVNDAGMTHHS